MAIVEIFQFLGAVALFIFGIKLINDGIQHLSKYGFKKIVNYFTSNKYLAFFSGIFFTSLVRSSSAIIILTMSFINAGLISLLSALCIVVGANIGTTITAWIIALLGFEFHVSSFTLPLIALALPLYFATNLKLRSISLTLIGFCLMFIGLDFMKEVLPNLLNRYEDLNFLNYFANYPEIIRHILYIIVGILITFLFQSSSISTSLALVLVYKGLPVEFAAYYILGANIGTTFTAKIASTIGNSYAKATANFHVLLNVFGVIFFLFFTNWSIQFLKISFNIKDNEVLLAAFHSFFNIVTAIIVFPFLGWICQLFLNRINTKPKDKQKNNLFFFKTNFTVSSDFYIYEAKFEVQKFAGIIKQTISILGRLITISESDKMEELILRIKQLENNGDVLEKTVTEYLKKMSALRIDALQSEQMHLLLNICHHLENIGDLAIKTSYLYKERREHQSYITPELRNKLIDLQDALSEATTVLIQNLIESDFIDIKEAKKCEKKINKLHDEGVELLFEAIQKEKIKTLSAVYFKEILYNYELIGDHLYKANLSLTD